ncbi:unnamed protein product [Darwinula stevensoni]|uniref:Major facilitator superfamily (MFS) profile domain-containing protein n=1 Tax=Darwinula stevensoni TaxID=69355 RepID=A0A7R8X8T8_9CRUS|nr:unnamed protein product [Darwinula stevensoni]CAG0888304.1 unnamed protein product [Darwinula stevensoni]
MASKRVSRRLNDDEISHLLNDTASDFDSNTELVDRAEIEDFGGYGRFHWRLMGVCASLQAADAIEILCISFLLPVAQCDLGLTSTRKGWLNALLFLGLLMGGYVGGSLSDQVGRKRVLIACLFLHGSAGLISSFMPNFPSFLAARLLSGVGVGGALPVNFPYFAEFQPRDRRGRMVTLLASCFLLGNLVVAGLAWWIIPSGWKFTISSSLEYNSWRIFVGACGLPSILAALFLLRFPESPKFLLSIGKEEEALRVVSLALETSMKGPRGYQGIPSLSLRWRESVKHICLQTVQLFRGNLLFRICIMIVIHFSLAFGYYGLWMWFPELFSRLKSYYILHSQPASVCDIIGLNIPGRNESTDPCDTKPVDPSVYQDQVLLAVAPLPMHIWTFLHMDTLGRKFFLVLGMVVSGVSVFLISLVRNSIQSLLLSMLFSAVSNAAFNAIACVQVELFPTHLRATGMALTAAALRIGAFLGNVIFGYFLDVSCIVPMMSIAIFLCGMHIPFLIVLSSVL